MHFLFVLVDSRLEPQTIDLKFIELLGENGIPFGMIFTKADKLSASQLRRSVERYGKVLSEQWEELPPHFITSSEKRLGREEFLNYIEQLNEMTTQQ
jgi:GTP-binding protein